MEGDDMILVTEPAEQDDGQVRINRMVWTDIPPDSLLWRWQKSTDGGASWSDLWTITYQRRP